MDNVTILNENEEEVKFVGELVDETFDEHQVERNHPINTETVKLYKKDDGQYLLAIMFQFDEMDPHHHEVHIGSTTKEILEKIAHPTAATLGLLQN